MTVIKKRIFKTLLFFLGFLSLILGIIGIFLPLLPTTPFVLLSAWCFLKSSPQAYRWIYHHRVLGESLRNWETTRSISRKVKLSATMMILASGSLMWMKVQIPWLRLAVTLLLFFVTVFILTRKEPSG